MKFGEKREKTEMTNNNGDTEKKTEMAGAGIENTVPEGVIKFDTPYTFEGKPVKELDLRGLKSLSYAEMQSRIMPIYETLSPPIYVAVPELTNEFIIAAAAYATGLPVEFFTNNNGLKFCHFFKLRTMVRNFLLQED